MAQVITNQSAPSGTSLRDWVSLGVGIYQFGQSLAAQQRAQDEAENARKFKDQTTAIYMLAEAQGKTPEEYLTLPENENLFRDYMKAGGFGEDVINRAWSTAKDSPLTFRQELNRFLQQTPPGQQQQAASPDTQATQTDLVQRGIQAPAQQSPTPAPAPTVSQTQLGAARGPVAATQTAPNPYANYPTPQAPGPQGGAQREAMQQALRETQPQGTPGGMGTLRRVSEPAQVDRQALAAQEAQAGRATYTQMPRIGQSLSAQATSTPQQKALVQKAEAAQTGMDQALQAADTAPTPGARNQAAAETKKWYAGFEQYLGRAIKRSEAAELEKTPEGRQFLRDSFIQKVSDPAWRAAFTALNPQAGKALERLATQLDPFQQAAMLDMNRLKLAKTLAEIGLKEQQIEYYEALTSAKRASDPGNNRQVQLARLRMAQQMITGAINYKDYQRKPDKYVKDAIYKQGMQILQDVYKEIYGKEMPPLEPGQEFNLFTLIGNLLGGGGEEQQATQQPQGQLQGYTPEEEAAYRAMFGGME